MAKRTKKYFIVNPAGAIHEVSEAHATTRLQQVGYRQPTKAELTAYKKTRTQRFDNPIAKPFNAVPVAVVEVEAEETQEELPLGDD